MGIVIANDPKSLAGIAYHTPSRFHNKGNTYAIGNNRKSCRESERKMLTFTFPMHWKKLVMVACEPTTKNTSISSLMPFAARSSNVASVVKIRAICLGKSIESPHPTNKMAVAQAIANHRQRNIRSNFTAP